jgi:hypothetical protein
VVLISYHNWLLVGAGPVLALPAVLAYALLYTDTADVAERDAPLVPRLAQTYPGPWRSPKITLEMLRVRSLSRSARIRT